MKLTFRLRFHTSFGESLLISGSHPSLGLDRVDQALPLHYLNNQFWQATIELAGDAQQEFRIHYHYILRQPDGSEIYDAGNQLTLDPESFSQPDVLMVDSWNPIGA